MFVRKWIDQFSKMQKRSLRFRLFLLIFLSTFPGALLQIHSIITQRHQEVLGVFFIAVSLELIEKDSRIGEQHKQMVLSE